MSESVLEIKLFDFIWSISDRYKFTRLFYDFLWSLFRRLCVLYLACTLNFFSDFANTPPNRAVTRKTVSELTKTLLIYLFSSLSKLF